MKRVRPSIVGLALLLASTLVGVGAPPAAAGARSGDLGRHQMFTATNQSRLTHRVARLRLNRAMSAIAQRHSEDMAARGYLFHTTNVKVYLNGVAWHAWGENVGYTQGGTVNDLQTAFMHSPLHRENILNGAYQHVAIGTVSQDGYLWVTVFFYG